MDKHKLFVGQDASGATRFGETKRALTQTGIDPSTIEECEFSGNASKLNVIGETNVQGGGGVEAVQTGLETPDNRE